MDINHVKPVIEIMKPNNLKGYARLCGLALARAHTRSADAVQLREFQKNKSPKNQDKTGKIVTNHFSKLGKRSSRFSNSAIAF